MRAGGSVFCIATARLEEIKGNKRRNDAVKKPAITTCLDPDRNRRRIKLIPMLRSNKEGIAIKVTTARLSDNYIVEDIFIESLGRRALRN